MTATLSLRFLFTKIPSSGLHNVFAKPAFSNLNSSANFLHKRAVSTTLNIQFKQNKLEIKNKRMSSTQYQVIEKGAPNSTNYSIYFSK